MGGREGRRNFLERSLSIYFLKIKIYPLQYYFFILPPSHPPKYNIQYKKIL